MDKFSQLLGRAADNLFVPVDTGKHYLSIVLVRLYCMTVTENMKLLANRLTQQGDRERDV